MGRWSGGCDKTEGKAHDIASVLAGIARATANRSEPFALSCVPLSRGETKVSAVALNRRPRMHTLARDT